MRVLDCADESTHRGEVVEMLRWRLVWGDRTQTYKCLEGLVDNQIVTSEPILQGTGQYVLCGDRLDHSRRTVYRLVFPPRESWVKWLATLGRHNIKDPVQIRGRN